MLHMYFYAYFVISTFIIYIFANVVTQVVTIQHFYIYHTSQPLQQYLLLVCKTNNTHHDFSIVMNPT